MNLIAISQDTLINPDQITSMELTRKKNATTLLVHLVDGRSYTAEVTPASLLSDLKRSGVNLTDQFFAG